MIEKMMNLVETLSDHMPIVCAVLLTALIAIFGFAFGFGIVLGMAWVTMLVYNVLANTFSWPTFSIWFWFGAWMVFGWVKKGLVAVTVKKGE